MIEASLVRLAEVLGAGLQGPTVTIRGLSTDSRVPRPGSLFVALRGPRFDGHAYAADALAAGAAGVLVEHADGLEPALVVADTREALGKVGHWWRQETDPLVVGVTGSNGKTTVKQMLVSILAGVGKTSATRGNLNNDVGVPLTLAKLSRDDQYAVIEMGANHMGEIAYLAGLARPDVALVNNANPAHLEGFGSIANIARAKGEIYEALGEDGVAVINADDPHAHVWMALAAGRTIVDFGMGGGARVRGRALSPAGHCRIELPGDTLELMLPVPGLHNLYNALAATAAAVALEIPAERIAAGLEGFEPPAGRLRPCAARCGADILDDSYNANPASLEAGARVLIAGAGEPWVALGDMAELGDDAPRLHQEAGRLLMHLGVRRLYACGPLSLHAAKGFGSEARHFDSRDDLIAALEQDLTAGVSLLVKGSRSSGMDKVVERLVGDAPKAGGR